MNENLAMPTSLENVSAVHNQALEDALQSFMENAIFDDEKKHQQQLQVSFAHG